MTRPPRYEGSDAALAYRMAFDRDLYYALKGAYACAKASVEAANSYVYMLCFRLDADRNVLSFRRGPRFEYFHPEKKKVEGSTLDLDVRMADGTRRLLYVTSENYVHTPAEEAMIEGAEGLASALRARFELWTEPDLFGPRPDYMRSVIRYMAGFRR